MAEIKMIEHDFKTAVQNYEKALNIAGSKRRKKHPEKKYISLLLTITNPKNKKIAKKLKKANIEVESNVPVLAFSYSTYIPANISEGMKPFGQILMQTN
jgi:hypothetical protein